ncbi:MAG: radical SAM protein [Planctomycetes bacterium]|nr:radical SAM protein [Planctomycetota bacterium]
MPDPRRGYLAAVELHPEVSSLGFPFPWDAPWRGRPILLPTLEAIARIPSVGEIAVVVPAEEDGFHQRLAALLNQIQLPGRKKAFAFPARGADIGRRARIPQARRLAPGAWRAGWAIPFAVAERGDPARLHELAQRCRAEELLLFPPAAPFIQAPWVEELVAGRARQSSTPVWLSTLPPGAAGDLLTAAYIRDLARIGLPLDTPLRFLPDRVERDLDTKGLFCWFPQSPFPLKHRLTAESKRGLAVLEGLAACQPAPGGGGDGSASWLEALVRSPRAGALFSGPVPQEVRFVVTSRRRQAGGGRSILDPPAAVPLGPSGSGAVDLEPELFESVVQQLGPWQEVRLVIGGGEPLLHPRLPRILEAARAGGIGSIIVETDGLELGAEEVDLLERCADVVAVALDAASGETYRRLRGEDRLAEAEGGVLRLLERAAARGWPAIAVEFREVEENRAESEEFFNRWFPKTPWVVLSPLRGRAGQLDRQPLHPHRLPHRHACIRIEESLAVFPDGRAAACDNDFKLVAPAGDLSRQSIEEVWTGPAMAALRQAHGEGRWGELSLCRGCDDWCRRG